MIKADATDLIKSMQTFQEEAERKLKAMVVGFASDVALAASEETPVGDADRYMDLYIKRSAKYGIEPSPGFHSGAWRYDPDGNLEFDSNIYEQGQLQQYVQADVKADYRIGDTFYIGATGPAYGLLNTGGSPKAPNGIMEPAMRAISAAYASNVFNYYKNG